MDQPTRVVTTCAASFLLASALHWLSIEYRDGILGTLQDVLAPVYVVPFILAGVMSGDIHAPSGGFFFLGLFFEAFLIVLAVLWLLILVSRRRSSR